MIGECVLGRAVIRRFGFMRSGALERTGYTLYGKAVAAARDPLFYTDLAVADTLDGRFDMICLHVALLTRRLLQVSRKAHGRELAQSVFDAMFIDMDGCLRESGVGDLGVPRRVRVMWEAFNGRARAYGEALDRNDGASSSEALLRNIWRGREDAGCHARRLAAWVVRESAALAALDDADLASGTVRFCPMQAGEEP